MRNREPALKCLAASGQLGHGIPAAALAEGFHRHPHFVGADMGSIDIGPYYLGSGLGDEDEEVVDRDLRLMLLPALELGIPAILGSAGSAGGSPHLRRTLQAIERVLTAAGRSARVAWIDAEVSESTVLDALRGNRVRKCGDASSIPDLSETSLRETTRIVAQMGVEPIIEALDTGADIVVAGRAVDSAIFEAIPLMKGYDRGHAAHMGKTIECASLCAVPGGRDAVLGYLTDAFFEVESLHPDRIVTAYSLAAHGLYEAANPYEIVGPGGRADLTAVEYLDRPNGLARATGARWLPNTEQGYELKLEGARWTGHRYHALGGIRCPRGVSEVEHSTQAIREMVAELLPDGTRTEDYELNFRLLGDSGALGEGEFDSSPPREVYVSIETLSQDQALAGRVCALARYNLLHYFYPNILATAGNLALSYVPSETYVGDAYEWSIYHLMQCEPTELFRIETEVMGSA